MFGFVMNFFILCSAYTAPLASSSEWVSLTPVVRLSSQESDQVGGDLSSWVVFSKQLGKENFMVRFPEAPTYRYTGEGEMEISAKHQETSYSLLVLDGKNEVSQDLLENTENGSKNGHEKDGKWIFTDFYRSADHLYVFQTKNPSFHRENHQKFISSLDIVFQAK